MTLFDTISSGWNGLVQQAQGVAQPGGEYTAEVQSPVEAPVEIQAPMTQQVEQSVPNYGGFNPLAGVSEWVSDHTSSVQNELKTDATLAGVEQPESPKVGSPDWYNTEISNREMAAKENVETPNYGGFNPFAAVGSWVAGGNKAAQENLEKVAEGNVKSSSDVGSIDSSNKENVSSPSGSEPIPSLAGNFLSGLFGGKGTNQGADQAVTQDEKPIPSIGNSFLDYISKPFQGTSLEEGSKPLPTWANAAFGGGSATASDGAKVVGKLDTSTPTTQKYSLIQAPDNAQQITRADYVKTQDLGDNKTKELLQQGYSPEQALAMQADAAKAANNGRAERYYRNELDKALENNIALSSQYHSDAMKSGLPQSPNPFAYAGDLSLSTLYKSQGVVNENGSRGLPQYGGSLLKEANLITKAERTFDTGPYNTTNLKSYSSTYGVLPLSLQQSIGAQAAKTATERGAGWDINPDTMKKYTPELIQGSGFALKYKEAADTLNPADYKSIKGFEQPTIFDYKNNAHVEDIFNTGERTTILNNKGENDQIFGVVNFGNKNDNGYKQLTPYKPAIDVVMGTSGETVNGTTMSSLNLNSPPPHYNYNGQLSELEKIQRGNSIWTGATASRYAKQFRSSTKRKPSYHPVIHTTVTKHNPKIFNLESLNKQVMPKTLGSDLFKFKMGASDMVMKPMSSKSISSGSKINSISDNFKLDNVGVNLSKGKSVASGNVNIGVNLSKGKSAVLGTIKPSKNKSVIGNINLDNIGINLPKNKSKSAGVGNTGINLPKNKSSVSGNIKNVMDDAVRSIKVKSMVK